jgi:hypothetical protein
MKFLLSLLPLLASPPARAAQGGRLPSLYMSHLGASPATFNSLRVNLQLWDSWSSGATPVFSNSPASMTGPFTLSPGTPATIDVTLAAARRSWSPFAAAVVDDVVTDNDLEGSGVRTFHAG